MKLSLALTGFLLSSCVAWSASTPESFVYDEHGKRDPFQPLVSSSGMPIIYEEDMTLSDMTLEGVVAGKDGGIAIISGKVFKPGDRYGAFTIREITADSVVLTKDQEHFVLKLKKGGL